MKPSQLRGVFILTLTILLGTVFGGWPVLPVVALGAGLATPPGYRNAGIVGGCAALAWSLLLALQGTGGVAVGYVARKIGELFMVPGIVFTLLVPVFAFALAWCVAAVGEELRAFARGTTAAPR